MYFHSNINTGFLEYRCKWWERNDSSRQSGFQSLTITNMLCVFATRHSRFAFSALVVGTGRKSYMPPIRKWFLSKLFLICSDGRQKALLSAKIFWQRANHVRDCKKLLQILPCWNISVLFCIFLHLYRLGKRGYGLWKSLLLCHTPFLHTNMGEINTLQRTKPFR